MFIDLGFLHMAEAQRQADAEFTKRIADLPTEMQSTLIADRNAMKERLRREALEERRHQELCAAIRRRSFWL